VFVVLALLVLASVTSSLAGYYYLQYVKCSGQVEENQHLMKEMATSYGDCATKYNALVAEYSALYGSYLWFNGDDCSSFMAAFGRLMNNLRGNYSRLLNSQGDLKESFTHLENKYQTTSAKGNVTREEFGELLSIYYGLFNELAMREVSGVISGAVALKVGVCIDYGNGTTVWYNETSVPPGSSLFDLTQKIVSIEYHYYPTAGPGHILLKSINGKAENQAENTYWFWYYWDEQSKKWVQGPVGCDAWMLKDSGTYKWSYESWS